MLRRSDRDPNEPLQTPVLMASPLAATRLIMLAVIATGPSTPGDIVDLLADTPHALTERWARKVVVELYDLGLVEIERNGRPTVWKITSEGRRHIRAFTDELHGVLTSA